MDGEKPASSLEVYWRSSLIEFVGAKCFNETCTMILCTNVSEICVLTALCMVNGSTASNCTNEEENIGNKKAVQLYEKMLLSDPGLTVLEDFSAYKCFLFLSFFCFVFYFVFFFFCVWKRM